MTSFAPVLLHHVAHGGLDVGAWLGPFDGGGNAILGQDGVYLGVAGFPYFLLQATDSVVLEKEVRLVGGEPPWWCLFI